MNVFNIPPFRLRGATLQELVTRYHQEQNPVAKCVDREIIENRLYREGWLE
jgi:hypothetical protein